MVVRKRKKVTKYRAMTTHGGGHRKKRRGAGSRGGRGRAGTGKRAGHHRQGEVLGKHGFVSRKPTPGKSINVNFFSLDMVNKLVSEGKIKKEQEMYIIDLPSLGYHKLLGTGSINVSVRVNVGKASARAIEKVTAAGGEVITTSGD
ncbi:50S ribosomal protein L15 [Candidatus Woesearchaeota archaeon]|jgi:large subunit ribosomal protein L15|nr:50S ribosomal protein L15 [Candidatus Woesearchaeota archaeon]MBT5739550.1 50S ribosomal protein L15 [Candidatus Woesearchaeota archaeon]